jgi:two-component system, NarL family, sensor histidine kinase DegS
MLYFDFNTVSLVFYQERIMSNSPFSYDGDQENYADFLNNELSQTKDAIKEITTTLEQSKSEFNRLTQKKATITAQLQLVQTEGDQISRQEIRDTFSGAMDAQQRLLVMKAQLDRLEEQLSGLVKYKNLLDAVLKNLGSGMALQSGKANVANGLSTLEMLINAQEAERQRLSRQMHDGPAQALSNFIVQTEIADRMFDIDAIKAKEELAKLKNSALSTFQKVRSFIAELRPMILDDLGLVPALKRYISNLKEQTGIEISETISGSEQKLPSYLEVFIFRAIQELVGNSVKHNMDNANKVKIEVSLALEPNSAKVIIKDNGKGFDTGELKDTGGLGLKILQERTDMLGGSININSTLNKGTEVSILIPVADVPVK